LLGGGLNQDLVHGMAESDGKPDAIAKQTASLNRL
jgi:hypothetical protein